MKDFVIIGQIGNLQIPVRVQRQFKTDNVYYVFIDKFLHGQVVRHANGWKAYLHAKSWLSIEDGQTICDIAEKNGEFRGFSQGSEEWPF